MMVAILLFFLLRMLPGRVILIFVCNVKSFHFFLAGCHGCKPSNILTSPVPAPSNGRLHGLGLFWVTPFSTLWTDMGVGYSGGESHAYAS
jgi:hypothetical protein